MFRPLCTVGLQGCSLSLLPIGQFCSQLDCFPLVPSHLPNVSVISVPKRGARSGARRQLDSPRWTTVECFGRKLVFIPVS